MMGIPAGARKREKGFIDTSNGLPAGGAGGSTATDPSRALPVVPAVRRPDV